MADGSFDVALVPLADGGTNGLEQIEFRVAGHAGVTLRPLAKVASGGELARISLALAVIASTASPTPTLIFDEVDTGIGGVAEIVGRLLHQLGRDRQVLCVTHLRKWPHAAISTFRWPSLPTMPGAPSIRSHRSTSRNASRKWHACLAASKSPRPRASMRRRCWRPEPKHRHQPASFPATANTRSHNAVTASRSPCTCAGSTRAFSIPSSLSVCCSLR